MKKVKFIVEKTNTGYSAYHENSKGIVATTGGTVAELKANILEAYNAQQSFYDKKPATEDSIVLAYDLGQFFEHYNVINVKALAQRMHMNYTLLSQYITGKKNPSEKQAKKVLQGVKQLGRELYEADFL